MGIYKSLTDTCMWKLGLCPPQFFFWEDLFQIFGIGSLQFLCGSRQDNMQRNPMGRFKKLACEAFSGDGHIRDGAWMGINRHMTRDGTSGTGCNRN